MKAMLMIAMAVSLLFGAYTRDNVLETVYDNQTNLTWQDSAAVTSLTPTWDAAIDYCENLDFAGFQDWRLPNFNELYMTVDHNYFSPTMDPAFQNVTTSRLWSSTTYLSDTTKAWVVYFLYGNDFPHDKVSTARVRCVRTGQALNASPVSVPLNDGSKAALMVLFALGAYFVMRRKKAL